MRSLPNIAVCVVAGGLLGCSGARRAPQHVFYPGPPDPPRVVHLMSFNDLAELHPPRTTWLDRLRGGVYSPTAGTPLAVATAGDVLALCDSATNHVHLWNLATGAASTLGPFGKPVGVAMASDGTVYVADSVRGTVQAFDSSGRPVVRFVSTPDQPFERPVAVAVDDRYLYIADGRGAGILQFDRLTAAPVGVCDVQAAYPAGLAVGRDGAPVVVGDLLAGRVVIRDGAASDVRPLVEAGDTYGTVGQPRAVALAPDGAVAIADVGFRRVHLFAPDGRQLIVFGGPQDQAGGTPLPNGIAIAAALPSALHWLLPAGFQAHYFMWVTNTTGGRRVALFAIGESATESALPAGSSTEHSHHP